MNILGRCLLLELKNYTCHVNVKIMVLTWVANVPVSEYLRRVILLRTLPGRPIQRDALFSCVNGNLIHLRRFSHKTDKRMVEGQCVELNGSETKSIKRRNSNCFLFSGQFGQWSILLVTFSAFDRLYSLPQYWHLYFF